MHPTTKPFVVRNARCPVCGHPLVFSPAAGLRCDRLGCGGPGGFQARLAQVSPAKPPLKGPRTHCRNGHEYTPENLYHYRGSRTCKACRLTAIQKWKAKMKTAR
jgi:hypothetical protein